MPTIASIADSASTFISFIARRELRFMRDAVSGDPLSYAARSIGLRGDASVEWVRASGRATLHSYTVYHQVYHDDFKVPYNVAWIELEEGPRLISTVAGIDAARLRIGMPLAASFEPSGRLVFVPLPEPVPS